MVRTNERIGNATRESKLFGQMVGARVIATVTIINNANAL